MAAYEHTEHTDHIVPPTTYVVIITILLCLTAATVGAAYINLGKYNIVVALAIATLKATLGGLADEVQGVDDVVIRLRADLQPSIWRPLVGELEDRLVLPDVDEKALAGLKFSDALPRHLAVATLANRLADLKNAKSVLLEPCLFER